MRISLLPLLIFLLTPVSLLIAGNDPTLLGARGIGLGRAYTAINGDLWAMSYNPAGLTFLPSAQAGFYTERRFGLKELLYGGASFAMPLKDRHYVGAEIGSFGFSNYRENKIGLTYATYFLDKLSIGTKINVANINIPDLGSSMTAWADIGLNVKVTRNIQIGASAYNVTQSKIKTQNGKQNIPTVLSTGICYTPSDKITIVADVQKDMTRPVSFRGGLEYKFYKGWCARVGAGTQPTLLTFGFGWQYKEMLSIDFSSSIHQTLGYTPHLSMTYKFGKKVSVTEQGGE